LPPAARRSFDITCVSVGSTIVPVRQHDGIALSHGVLANFSRPPSDGRRVLVIAPLAGGFPILLRDMVVGLLRHLDQVAVTDWPDVRYVSSTRGRFGFDENVAHIASMIREFGPDLHVVGVCQGVVPALIATALLASEEPSAAPISLVLMGGPVDPFANPTRVVHLLNGHSAAWFEKHALVAVGDCFPGAGRLVYPRSLQLSTLNGYITRHMLTGGEPFWKLVWDDGEDPWRFPFWTLAYALMDLPGEFFIENIVTIFQNNSLRSGRLRLDGTRIDLRAMSRTALMTVEGEADDIAAPGQTSAAHALCRSVATDRRRHLLVPRSGHFSLFHGGTWRSRILPAILDFFDAAERKRRARRKSRRA
jgi:poly(3-hydroxybutyrate) depolymerase